MGESEKKERDPGVLVLAFVIMCGVLTLVMAGLVLGTWCGLGLFGLWPVPTGNQRAGVALLAGVLSFVVTSVCFYLD